ncbi:phage terminase small subunit P27 family [Oceanobacter sp. 3_MG-2023]|uniref:phage terminase small subunit P27 family n=1 Tax=Oceanobacter sp. 3_MG-2023 TaxID=3062622 RepID=UPI002735C5A9|nr:phage terminase small subunit P27 family [Oceanobacter sp. 3_MG-2023]MDP2505394.1 phage terminase small subunit P27 family [Oceanobacter sp. 3_MG-2023]
MAGGKGRKPKPTAAKQAAGNPGKRALNTNEPEFTQLLDVDPPEHLHNYPHAVECWETHCPELCKIGVLKVTDLWNLEAFCMAYSTWRESKLQAQQQGITITQDNGTEKKNPALSAANEALRQMMSLGAVLGLDPANRTRLVVPKQKDQSNPFAELAGLLAGK